MKRGRLKGRRGRKTAIIIIRAPESSTQDELIQQGYRVEEGQLKRRDALAKAVHEYGYAEVAEKINALVVMNRLTKRITGDWRTTWRPEVALQRPMKFN